MTTHIERGSFSWFSPHQLVVHNVLDDPNVIVSPNVNPFDKQRYAESLEIQDPPGESSPYVIHAFSTVEGSMCYSFDSLKCLNAFFEMFLVQAERTKDPDEKMRILESLLKLNDFGKWNAYTRKDPYGVKLPWFFNARSMVVWHGAYGWRTKFFIVQHAYTEFVQDEEPGFHELLEIKDPPPNMSPFVIHTFTGLGGSVSHLYRSLKEAQANFDRFFRNVGSHPSAPHHGLITCVEHEDELPWYYQEPEEAKAVAPIADSSLN